MHLLIVSDIFGRTKALEELSCALSSNVEIFDPYDSIFMNFKNEEDAYSYFQSNIGIDKYASLLFEKIKSLDHQVLLLGFSIGGSAIWKISELKNLKNVFAAKCFYSSQIRHYTKTNPLFPIHLIFPSYEEHFLISNLIFSLCNKKNVQVEQFPYLHGFMNKHSKNYNAYAYNLFINSLQAQ